MTRAEILQMEPLRDDLIKRLRHLYEIVGETYICIDKSFSPSTFWKCLKKQPISLPKRRAIEKRIQYLEDQFEIGLKRFGVL